MYLHRRSSRSSFVHARGLRHHVREWGEEGAPRLFLLHGWMDVSASFQFLVDAFATERHVLAPDWRGYGLTDRSGDAYWMPDYLADLDALLDVFSPHDPVDLVAHSMGGNVAVMYAGVRPERVRRVVNLEGLGMPATVPEQAPGRLAAFLDELRSPPGLKDYASLEEVAARLMKNNPRLGADRAGFLARHWSGPAAGGRRVLLADPAHKITNPYLYRVDEVMAVWRRITAPVLWVQSDPLDAWHRFANEPAYQERLGAIANLSRATVRESGHMLHHDQPEAVAQLVEDFLDAP